MKRKHNPELLKEDVKRFRLLCEYDFYQETKEAPKYKDILDEVDEEPNDLKPEDDVDAAANDLAGDLGVDAPSDAPAEEPATDAPAEEPAMPEPDMEEPDMEEPAIPEPDSNDVEVDVTSLVKGSEEAKQSADMATKNTEMLLQKLGDLEQRMQSMVAISDKIEGLEKEIIKRNPTPVEKLEMRSLSSYPFNQKLSDYWADKEGAYDVMDKNKPKEYVLTKKDVDSDYSDNNVMKSFTPDNNPYDEEDIDNYDEEDL
jgi:hypothetical protein